MSAAILTANMRVMTNAEGVYWVERLPPATYDVATYYGNCTLQVQAVVFDHPSQLVQRIASDCPE